MVSSPSLRRRTVATALVVLGAGLPACGRDDPPARAAPAAAAHGIRFDDVTEACGVRSTRRSGGGDDLRNIAQAAGGGVAVLDADGDGWMDLFFTEGGTDPDLTPDAKTTSGRGALWRNRGDGTFEDVTDRAGLRELGAYPFGATAADWDGDGDTDLYVCTYRRDRLFRNEGGLRFVDATEAAGVVEDAFSVHAVFLDYDRDGALDLYVVRYLAFDPSYRVFYAPEGFPGPLSYRGVADLLWHNRGDGTFEDVTKAAGVLAPDGRGMSAVSADFDDDGWPDLFVANDAMENWFWRNRGDGTFENVAARNGTAYGLNGESTAAMGASVGDWDGDGRLDLFVPDSGFSCLYTNAGATKSTDGAPLVTFRDRSAETGLAEAGGQSVGWSGHFLDADLDGRLDLVRTAGNDHHLFGEPLFLLRNRGDRAFEDVSRTAGPVFSRKLVARGAATAGLWNDGRLGLVVTMADGPAVVLRDTSTTGNHALALALVGRPSAGAGPKSTRAAVGARVRVTTPERTQTFEVRAGEGYLSSSDPRVHVGLGAATSATVEVRWPSGRVQTLTCEAGRVHRVEEPAGDAAGGR